MRQQYLYKVCCLYAFRYKLSATAPEYLLAGILSVRRKHPHIVSIRITFTAQPVHILSLPNMRWGRKHSLSHLKIRTNADILVSDRFK